MYRFTLTEDDVRTIAFVAGRYCWSDALRHFEAGAHEIRESDAWKIREACERDTEGGHSLFPMLDSRSELYEKLLTFIYAIV